MFRTSLRLFKEAQKMYLHNHKTQDHYLQNKTNFHKIF